MLNQETPFPQVGSYALLIDKDQPHPQPTELVRILRRNSGEAFLRTSLWQGAPIELVTVSFPLRDGASGTKSVPFSDLIDGTELTPAEARELADLDRELHGRSMRTQRQKEKGARRDALKLRAIWAPALRRLMRGAAAGRRRKAA